jgi:dihydroneopterin aldolase / 2-amino-4-hydroxy-6-hydroxymethyldihydropteridine diphosphokinase / dihydropteroate synthase
MATLNVTPDSFSDGGLHLTTSKAVAYALDAVAEGADIIDVGGFSTRPGAPDVPLEEELHRVVPVIQALRNAGISCPISVDTFRPEVACQAVLAGANCVNDVRALREEGMREAVKELGVPVVMMHSRTDAGKQTSYAPHGVMAGVRDELGAEIKKALHHGIRRWNIVVDPGIGFSKTLDGNLELIRNLKKFTEHNTDLSRLPHGPPGLSNSAGLQMPDVLASMPVLVGTSRKSYLGAVIERPRAPASERDAATLAACAAAIQQGCDILRVHDVGSAKDASRVADALWRT